MNQPKKGKRKGKSLVIDRTTMILLGIAAVILLAVGGWMWFSQQGPADFVPEVSGAPNVSVDQPVIDYGDVKLGETIETVFVVENTGDRPLHVLGEPQVELLQGC